MRLRHLLVVAAAVFVSLAGAPAVTAAPAPSRWCGSDESAADRTPDAVAAYQVHAVYAIPSDGTDRFFERAFPIARDLAAIDTWWRGQDATRAPRFDLQAFPGCDSTFGALDISVLRLPQAGPAYAGLETGGYRAMVTDLVAALTNPYKKYLVYYDGPIDQSLDVCGVSSLGPIDRGASFAITFLDSGPYCGSLGGSDYMATTEVHELLHNLGAVDSSAPHLCEGAHVCDSIADIMAPYGTSNSLFDYILDAGRDDYYGHSGTWWDVQDSAFLAHLDATQFNLTVSRAGAGEGTVTSDLPGIACPPACAIAWDSGAKVTLQAAANGDRDRFAGWSGACSGDGPCVLTMDAAKSVAAAFAREITLRLAVVRKGGAGRITSSPGGIGCPESACESSFDAGTSVVLTAQPDARSRLAGWSVSSCGTQLSCTLHPNVDTSVSVTFGPGFYRITAAVQGAGRVRSTPAGISCTRTCSASFAYGRTVRLTATPAKGWRFVGWSGACRGARACVLKAVQASVVRAAFRKA